jgi:hypothetical protein
MLPFGAVFFGREPSGAGRVLLALGGCRLLVGVAVGLEKKSELRYENDHSRMGT